MPVEYLTVSHISITLWRRIFANIEFRDCARFPQNPCWQWVAGLSIKGYVSISINGCIVSLHRFMYAYCIHPLPKGKRHGVVDHVCRNRACINPAHLEFVSDAVNIMRGEGLMARQARRTHCPQGHPLSGDNLYITPSTGGRSCRICRAEHTRVRRNADPERHNQQNRKYRLRHMERARERSRLAMQTRRAILKNDPGWRERQRQEKRAAYARQKQNPEWVAKERQRLRDLYARQKADKKT